MNTGHRVLVFGSNEAGKHAGGAAYYARNHWGAVSGVGFGPQGKSFAIPTMDWDMHPLSLTAISHYVERFLRYARVNPEMQFLVTAVGCGIAGFSEDQIKPMFADAPPNCILPAGWQP